jgi:hypothetical protein
VNSDNKLKALQIDMNALRQSVDVTKYCK